MKELINQVGEIKTKEELDATKKMLEEVSKRFMFKGKSKKELGKNISEWQKLKRAVELKEIEFSEAEEEVKEEPVPEQEPQEEQTVEEPEEDKKEEQPIEAEKEPEQEPQKEQIVEEIVEPKQKVTYKDGNIVGIGQSMTDLSQNTEILREHNQILKDHNRTRNRGLIIATAFGTMIVLFVCTIVWYVVYNNVINNYVAHCVC